MKQEVVTTPNVTVPASRRRRIGRLARFGAYALGALVVVKVAMAILSVVVSIAVVGVIALLIAGVVAIMLRR